MYTVVAIHDMSGVGRCSLTVIIPTLSVMGVQCCPVPTAVFSTHTGGLGDVVKRDLTEFLIPSLEHYKNLDMNFSSIYTGYLASQQQVDICLEYFSVFPNAFHVVDPVMGDHGKVYKSFTQEMQQRMKELVSKADMITPNLTEACIILGREYTSERLNLDFVKEIVFQLSKFVSRYVILTGLSIDGYEDKIANVGYDAHTKEMFLVCVQRIPQSYPGTGDLFTSVITGEMVNKGSLEKAMIKATKFVAEAVYETYKSQSDSRFGVHLESVLYKLATGMDIDVGCEKFNNIDGGKL